MTRWLLVLGLWGMLAGPAWAETTWVYPLGNGTFITCNTCGESGCTLLACPYGEGSRPITCEQKMQAAMEAMDRFMPMAVAYDILKQISDTREQGRVDEERLTSFIAAASSAERIWTDAKTCWRKP